MHHTNQSLFDLAVPFIKAINGGGRPTGGGRSKGAEGGMAISKFMNRILALKVDLQHDVFGFFEQVRCVLRVLSCLCVERG